MFFEVGVVDVFGEDGGVDGFGVADVEVAGEEPVDLRERHGGAAVRAGEADVLEADVGGVADVEG